MLLESLQSTQWRAVIESRVDRAIIDTLESRLSQADQDGKTVYPPKSLWFQALNHLNPDQVRVVILGQDPYHGPGQAQGLSFSVPEEQPLPPSLRNMFKELESDLGIINSSGDLTAWSEQGVLLLNSVLTVEAGRANAHAGWGWEHLTDAVIKELVENHTGIVFMLWGNQAQKKGSFIDPERHCVLKAAHPSPLSAYRGWFGCRHYSQANAYLQTQGREPIDWATGVQKQPDLF